MTYNQLYHHAIHLLEDKKIENAKFDAFELLSFTFNIDRIKYILLSNQEVNPVKAEKYLKYIKRRCSREPLQYIIGQWDFMGSTFKLGQGVLVPREDTAVVVETALKLIRNNKKQEILDLCAGAGTISIPLAKASQNFHIISIEKYDEAFKYLCENVKINNTSNITCIQGDIMRIHDKFHNQQYDTIVSNPPYIKTDDIPSLQEEVKKEPITALDGGKDGLVFYRNIYKNWSRKLKPNGIIILEVGFDIFSDLVSVFTTDNNFNKIDEAVDLNGKKRAVAFKKIKD